MQNEPATADRLPWSVEQGLLVHHNIYLAAREAVISVWCELPAATWQEMKPVLERWIEIGNLNKRDMRRIIDEVEYRRSERRPFVFRANDNEGAKP